MKKHMVEGCAKTRSYSKTYKCKGVAVHSTQKKKVEMYCVCVRIYHIVTKRPCQEVPRDLWPRQALTRFKYIRFIPPRWKHLYIVQRYLSAECQILSSYLHRTPLLFWSCQTSKSYCQTRETSCPRDVTLCSGRSSSGAGVYTVYTNHLFTPRRLATFQ